MTDNNGKNGLLAGWHMRKEFHLGNVSMLILWAVTGVWWLANIDGRVDTNARNLAREITERKDADDRNRKQIDERFARISQRLSVDLAEIKTFLRRIEDKVDRKADK